MKKGLHVRMVNVCIDATVNDTLSLSSIGGQIHFRIWDLRIRMFFVIMPKANYYA